MTSLAATSQVLDASGQPVSGQRITDIRRNALMASYSQSAFRAASTTDQDMAGWRPSLASADADWNLERNTVVARVTDLLRNDPVAVAGRSRRTDMVVGSGLRLQARVDYAALGLERDDAKALNKAIEREWRTFANDPLKRCDVTGRHSVGEMMRLAEKESYRGEYLMAVRWKPNSGARYATALQLIDPDRLSNPNYSMDTPELTAGVERDADGLPVAYHIQNAHPGDIFGVARGDQWSWTREARLTPWGRPRIIHGFEADRVDQTRGVPDLAPVINRLKMLTRYADAEVASAVVNAMFAAFIKTGHSPEDAASMLMDVDDHKLREQTYEKVKFNGVRLPVLAPGDEIEIPDASREHGGFTNFMTSFLQSIASTLDLSYEQLSMDFSNTNYSSARAALNEVWRSVDRRRKGFVSQCANWIYMAFLEEALDRYIHVPDGLPGFWDAPAAWMRCEWIGPGRGFIDPVKEAQGAELRVNNLTSTRTIEAAMQGYDLEELLDMLEQEKEMMADRDLSAADLGSMLAVQAPTDRVQDQRR
ncbi:MAG: phage portal protein [Pseudomonadota bacterium]